MQAQQPEFQMPGPRIVVVGVTGSGKTTTALSLANTLDIPHVELDSIHWLHNWVPVDTDVFRAEITRRLAAPAWVTDGNYSKARDIIWQRATTLVWLDYSLPVILWQLAWRTVRRIARRELLWNGNRETWRGAFFSKDSLFLWALSTHPKHRLLYPQLLASPEYAGLQVIHLHTRAETTRWLKYVCEQQEKVGQARSATQNDSRKGSDRKFLA